jgi:hypothetical protein
MNRFLKLFALFAIVFLYSFTADTWKVYNSKDGHYSVSMPGIPEEAKGNVHSDYGWQVSRVASLMPKSGDIQLFISSYSDYPIKPADPKITKEDAERLIDGTINTLVRNMGGTIFFEKPISYKGDPGKHAKVKMKSQTTIFEMKVYLIGARTYVLTTAYDSTLTNTATVDRFFNSFEVITAK